MYLRIALILSLFTLNADLWGQPTERFMDRITPLDGLSHPTIYDVVQDYDGFLWIATEEGLNRYDGYEFITYYHDPQDSTTLSDNHIYNLELDLEGNLWMSTWAKGVNRMNPRTGEITRFMYDPGDSTSLSHNATGGNIIVDSEGIVWIGTPNALNQFDPEIEGFHHYRHDPEDDKSLTGNLVASLLDDSDGNLWVGTGHVFTQGYPGIGGLNKMNRSSGSFTRYVHIPGDSTSLYDNRVLSLYEDRDGLMWIAGSSSSLHSFDRSANRIRRWFPSGPIEQKLLSQQASDSFPFSITDNHSLREPFGLSISDMLQDHHGDIWMGTFFGGLVQFDKKTESMRWYKNDINDDLSIADDRIIHLNKDRQGLVWIASMNGLNKINPYLGKFQSVMPKEGGLRGALVNGLSVDSSGYVWLQTHSSSARFNPSTGAIEYYDVQRDNTRPQLVSVATRHQYLDWEGMIWSAQVEGLIRVNPQNGTYSNYHATPDNPDGLKGDQIFFIDGDSSGRIWVTTDIGVQFKDPGSDQFTLVEVMVSESGQSKKALLFSTIRDVDHSEIFWLGTNKGLFRLDLDAMSFERYLESSLISDIYDAQNGTLWVGTENEGVFSFDKDTKDARLYTHFDGLSSNLIRSVIGDDRGRIWVATGNHLSMIDPDDGAIYNYGPDEGMHTTRFNQLSVDKAPDGTLYFGGDNGFLFFNPNSIDPNPYPPQIAFTDIRINDTPLENPNSIKDTGLELTYLENDIEVTFAGIHLDRPEKNQYMYMLEGYDEQWKAPGTNRTATYTNLSHGDYVLRVKASSADGVWTVEDANIRMNITPPWWRTAWSYTLFTLIGVGMLYFASRVQRAQQIKALNNKAQVREAQLKAEHAEEQTRILAEMDQVKSRFFANISHEFRTPLTLLLGPIRDAREGHYDLSEKQWQQQLGMMERNGHKLLQLINQLLDLSRLESGRVETDLRQNDLVTFLRRIVMSFSSLAKRESIVLQHDFPPESEYLYFDADKLEIVVSNLLSNAFKFTEAQGKILVQMTLHDEYAHIIVQDTGKGIPEDELPFVFDRFYQASHSSTSNYQGTGIGLSLCKELVELHGGHISLESTVGFGTTFTVQIPRTLIPQDQNAISVENTHFSEESWYSGVGHDLLEEEDYVVPDENAPIVLVVDDNRDVRAYLRLHLNDYRVEEAKDGAEGFEKAKSLTPHLIISDVMMPHMDGFELCERIKGDAALNHIPVLLLTARSAEGDKLEGLRIGADAYLMKPFNARELLILVENLITIRGLMKDKFTGKVRVEPQEIEVSAAEATFLEKVRKVVEEHMHNDSFTVEFLAGEVAISPRQLQRRLRAGTNLSASGYIRKMRLERARQLLTQEWGNVSEVAHAVGFRSVPHFSKIFKQVYGVLPSQYQKDN